MNRKARRVEPRDAPPYFALSKISGLLRKATLRWMRNVLPLAFTRTRGSFFNVARLVAAGWGHPALPNLRHTDRLTTVGLPPV